MIVTNLTLVIFLIFFKKKVTKEWKPLWSFGDVPQPRDSHSAVIYKNKMIIAGLEFFVN
jgi:hypothetical protein